ncbi:MAG TPA: hypothetical protein VFR67_03255 [Pilimelia sp.]|nr:hypothetical protein [Pilimelia sp.]
MNPSVLVIGAGMNIKVVDEVHESLIEDAWQLYHDAFRELNALAVQRHLMYRDEFDAVMADQRVQKYLCMADGDTLCGLATYTNDLEAVPLISPQYFERRWPQHYAERRIWYCGFVAVHPSGRAANAFGELVEAMYLEAATQNGIIALDMCRLNDQVRRLSKVVPLMLRRLSASVRTERMDEQSYWLYEFPAA